MSLTVILDFESADETDEKTCIRSWHADVHDMDLGLNRIAVASVRRSVWCFNRDRMFGIQEFTNDDHSDFFQGTETRPGIYIVRYFPFHQPFWHHTSL